MHLKIFPLVKQNVPSVGLLDRVDVDWATGGVVVGMPVSAFRVFGVGGVVTATHGAVVVNDGVEVIHGGLREIRVFVDE